MAPDFKASSAGFLERLSLTYNDSETNGKRVMRKMIGLEIQRARTAFNVLAIFLFLLCCGLPAAAQENGGDKPAKLFDREDTLTVTMTAPWRDIVRRKNNQDPYPAKIEYKDENGNTVSLEMTVERRGLTRQKVCRYPPIKLRFEKKTVKGTAFRGQKSLKLVTHCEKSSRFEQYYILEMLAYRMYNLITDFSFRIRPLTVNYADSKSGDVDDERFAFLIEDDSDVAKRNGFKKLNVPKVRLAQLDPTVTSEFTMFQYMIANVDWSAISGPGHKECCHNSKLIGPEPLQSGDIVYPIPYDLDSAGLIDAHYAVPPDGLPIRSVTQRLFRGYCVHNDKLEATRKKFLASESDILALIKNDRLLNSGTKKKSVNYLEKFFDILKDPGDFDKRVIQKCRK
jgi:hypothetical protein